MDIMPAATGNGASKRLLFYGLPTLSGTFVDPGRYTLYSTVLLPPPFCRENSQYFTILSLIFIRFLNNILRIL
jgi:hypothetical protein